MHGSPRQTSIRLDGGVSENLGEPQAVCFLLLLLASHGAPLLTHSDGYSVKAAKECMAFSNDVAL